VLGCTVFLVLWLRRPRLRSLLLIVVALGWVLVCNALRVVIIAVAFDRGGTDLSVGVKHDALGFACFALAVVLIWSTDRLFLFLMPRAVVVPRPAPPSSSALPAREALCSAARLLSWPMAVAFGLLFLLHAATYGISPGEGPGELLPGIAELDENSLPEQLAGWQRERFYTETRDTGSAYGEHSKFWIYKNGQRTAVVAVDYPFQTFHVLNECYINQGWSEERTSSIRGEKAEGEPPFYVEVQLQKSAMRTGYLLYSECNQTGEYLEHEAGTLRSAWTRYETALNGWRQRVAHPAEAYERLKDRGPAYQFQIFVESNRPLTAEDKAAVQRLYFQAVTALRKELYPAL
jgi:exosortase/archaeosortase family protein